MVADREKNLGAGSPFFTPTFRSLSRTPFFKRIVSQNFDFVGDVVETAAQVGTSTAVVLEVDANKPTFLDLLALEVGF